MNDPNTSMTPQREVAAMVENQRRFLAFLERRIGDRDTAEEILQAAFVRAVERAGQIRDRERVVAWFYRLLRHAVTDHWRALAAEKRGIASLSQEMAGRHAPAPEIAAQICHCFEPLLATLKPEHEAILRRVDLGGMRPSKVAAEDGITANAAMVRLHRARRALRGQLQRTCRACAVHGCLDCTCRVRPGGRSALGKGSPRAPSACSEGEERTRPAASHRKKRNGRKGVEP